MFTKFSKVALKKDLPEFGVKSGDVGVIVEIHPGVSGQEGVTLEFFNAVGETIAVPTVKESEIETLTSNEVLHVRRYSTEEVTEPPIQYKTSRKK